MYGQLKKVKKTFQNHGARSALNQFLHDGLNKFFPFKVLDCMCISDVNSSYLTVDDRFQHGFADREKIMQFSQSKINQLPEHFLSKAFEKGDKCYAITDDESLACYSWYSNTSTLTDIHQLNFSFNPSYIYMYKGLTNTDYRGLRLYAVGVNRALKYFLNRGYRGLICYVESTNYDSLKSNYRMGYKKIGFIMVTRIFGKVFHYSSKSCQEFNIKLQC